MKILDNIRHHLRPVLSTFSRPFDGELQGFELVGAEVGVFQGAHAKQFVNKSNVQTLYCIDPYVGRRPPAARSG